MLYDAVRPLIHISLANLMRYPRAIAIIVAVMFQLLGAGAHAQTLGELTRYCEALENYWRVFPPTGGTVTLPNQGSAAICFGFILAVDGLRSLLGIVGGDNSSCQRSPDGRITGGASCRPTLGICPPRDVTHPQELAVFLTYARSHPAQSHEPATAHFLSAMIMAFPCKDQPAAPAAN